MPSTSDCRPVRSSRSPISSSPAFPPEVEVNQARERASAARYPKIALPSSAKASEIAQADGQRIARAQVEVPEIGQARQRRYIGNLIETKQQFLEACQCGQGRDVREPAIAQVQPDKIGKPLERGKIAQRVPAQVPGPRGSRDGAGTKYP